MRKTTFKEYWYSRPNNTSYRQAEVYSLKNDDDCYFSRSEIFWDRTRALELIFMPVVLIGLFSYLSLFREDNKHPKPVQNSLEQKAIDISQDKEFELIQQESKK